MAGKKATSFAEMVGSIEPENVEPPKAPVAVVVPDPTLQKKRTSAPRAVAKAPGALEFSSNAPDEAEIKAQREDALRQLAPAMASLAAMDGTEQVNIQGKGGKNLQMMLALYAKSQGVTVGDIVPLACQEFLSRRLEELGA